MKIGLPRYVLIKENLGYISAPRLFVVKRSNKHDLLDIFLLLPVRLLIVYVLPSLLNRLFLYFIAYVEVTISTYSTIEKALNHNKKIFSRVEISLKHNALWEKRNL